MKIVKTCPKHGELSTEQCFIRVEKRWGKGRKESYSCRTCKKESSDKYRNRPEVRDKLIEKGKRDRIKFKEKNQLTRKLWVKRNREHINKTETIRRHRNLERFKELMRAQQKKWRDSLDDNYIKSQLRSKYKIAQKDVPSWMIEIKRVVIQLRRKIREKKA